LKFLVQKKISPNDLVNGLLGPTKIELANSVVTDAAMDIDMVSWNSITADVDLMRKEDTPFKDGRLPITGVAPGAYLWSR
jgi:hypothetical protein